MIRKDHMVERNRRGGATRPQPTPQEFILLGVLGAGAMGPHGCAGPMLFLMGQALAGVHETDVAPESRRALPPPSYSLLDQFALFIRDFLAYRRLCRLVGRRLDIPYHKAPDLLEHARTHGWIEAEKAGRDIWAERSPRNPEAALVRDWFVRHYDAWRRHHLRQGGLL
ncbi:MAG: hypothetical protein KF858_07905 [Candidatus Sumerlaeia bacterium]|nr:hypothetical protein [Candidatus Sumerlaeia bacterium]